MSLGLYSVYRMINPLQHVVRGFLPQNNMQSSTPSSQRVIPRSRPLRVAHIVDGTTNGTRMGRLVISGRMADVCAELDRLVEMEQRLQH